MTFVDLSLLTFAPVVPHTLGDELRFTLALLCHLPVSASVPFMARYSGSCSYVWQPYVAVMYARAASRMDSLKAFFPTMLGIQQAY